MLVLVLGKPGAIVQPCLLSLLRSAQVSPFVFKDWQLLGRAFGRAPGSESEPNKSKQKWGAGAAPVEFWFNRNVK